MPVNLLPQTPPQVSPGAKGPEATDDTGATSFNASLVAARSACPPAAAPRAAAEAGARGTRDPQAEDSAAATLDALALLGVPGLAAAAQVTTVGAASNAVTDAGVRPSGERAEPPSGATAATAGRVPAALVPSAAGEEPPRAAPITADVRTATPGLSAPTEAPQAAAPQARIAPTRTEAPAWREAFTAALGVAPVAVNAETAKSAAMEKIEIAAAPRIAAAAHEELETTDPLGAMQAPPPAPVKLEITTPALTPGWRAEIVDRVAQLVVLRHDTAEIRIHPEDLGPVSVKIQFDGNEANLLIQAPQPATRDALDLALPQLRDALAQQGITLGQATVHDERRPQSHPAAPSADESRLLRAGGDPAPVASVRVMRGLVDLFA